MNLDYKKISAYGGFAIALLAFLAMTLGFLNPTFALALMGLGGFGGIDALRSFISSHGLKTHLLAAFGLIIGVLCILKLIIPATFAWFTTETIQILYVTIATLAGITLTQAENKT